MTVQAKQSKLPKVLSSALEKLSHAPPETAQRLYYALREAGCTFSEVYALLGENIACVRIDAYPTVAVLPVERLSTESVSGIDSASPVPAGVQR
jgi:hypothetical protein